MKLSFSPVPASSRLCIVLGGLLFSVLLAACGGGMPAAQFSDTPQAPSLSTQPKDTSVLPGEHASFNVAVVGAAPLSYQWQKAGAGSALFVDIDGSAEPSALTDSYTSSSINPANHLHARGPVGLEGLTSLKYIVLGNGEVRT